MCFICFICFTCLGIGTNGDVFTSEAANGIPQNETTFGTALQNVGYTTMAVGKWHLGQRPQFLSSTHVV